MLVIRHWQTAEMARKRNESLSRDGPEAAILAVPKRPQVVSRRHEAEPEPGVHGKRLSDRDVRLNAKWAICLTEEAFLRGKSHEDPTSSGEAAQSERARN